MEGNPIPYIRDPVLKCWQRPDSQPNYFLSSSAFLLLKVSLINLLINLHSTGPVGHSNLTNLFWQLIFFNGGHIFDIFPYNITRSADIREQTVMACISSSTGPQPGLPLATLGPWGPQKRQPLWSRGTGGGHYGKCLKLNFKVSLSSNCREKDFWCFNNFCVLDLLWVFESLQTSQQCIMGELAGEGSVASTGDTQHTTRNMWHMTHDMWHGTRDTWHLTLDTWHVLHDFFFLLLPLLSPL